MAFYAVLFAGLAASLSVTGFVGAHPQQLFQPQQQQQPPRYEPITEICLGCICEAISSCNRNLTCEGDVCGMFRITWAYWADSGKPVLPGDNPNDGQAHARCLNDANCARQSVVNYLTRFAQDCNRDGIIDCLDYASIHKLGGYGCSAPLDQDYQNKYNKCQRDVYELSGPMSQQNSDVIFQNPVSNPETNSVPQQQIFN